MNRQQFDFEFGKKHGVNSFQLTDTLTVFRKPYEIWNEETDESIYFKNVDELLKYEIEGVTVWDLIKNKDHLYGDLTINGGRGSGSGRNKTFHMGHAGSDGKGDGKDSPRHFPAEANVKIKTKTYDEALKQFSNFAKDKTKEYSYEVDGDGYVYGLIEGGGTSTSFTSMKKGSTIFHNHPLPKDATTSHFSDTDLFTFTRSNFHNGMVATHNKGTHTVAYQVHKGTHFNATGFEKMVRSASKGKGIQGKTYDDAVDKMLKANAKKYGYTYKVTKIKI